MKVLCFVLVAMLHFVCFGSIANADNEALALKFNFKDDKVSVVQVNWIRSKSKISKTDGRNSKSKTEREFLVELLNSARGMVDSAVLRLTYSLSVERDGRRDRGMIMNDRQVFFPLSKEMIFLRVSKDDKVIFEKELAAVLAEDIQAYIQRKEFFGMQALVKLSTQTPYVAGKERFYFEGLLSATDGCKSVDEKRREGCLFIERTATKGLAHTLNH